MPERIELNPWDFHILAPEHPDGFVSFTFAIDNDVTDQLRAGSVPAWAVVLEQVDEITRKEIEDSLS